MVREDNDSTVSASLDAGVAALAVEIAGYAYDDDAKGSDADWLRGSLRLRSDQLSLDRPFLVLAPLQPWSDALARLATGQSARASIRNTEDDFELVVERVGGDLKMMLTAKVWGEPLSAEVKLASPVTMSAVESFRDAVEEMGWAYPPRSK